MERDVITDLNSNTLHKSGDDVDLEMVNEGRTVASVLDDLDELRSLGIDAKRTNDLNNKQELEELTCIIKHSMYEDYQLAYSRKGEKHKEEAEATVNI